MRSIDRFPPIEYVHQAFVESQPGHLFWTVRPIEHFEKELSWHAFNKKYPGKEAGGPHRDHHGMVKWRVKLGTEELPRSSVIWAFHYNEWKLNLDHKNRDSLDDQIDNLRVATSQQQAANRKVFSHSKTGWKGVTLYQRDGRYQARIFVNGRMKYLKRYDTPEEAHEAYMKAAIELHGEFACSGKE
jgi:hypothetical protein